MPAVRSDPAANMDCRVGLRLLAMTALLSSCAVGPDYVKPAAPMTATFKEATGDWKTAAPQDNLPRGAWWNAFGDADLNALEEQVKISNQNVKVAEAQYRQARALVAEARAAYFPTVSANGSLSRSGGGAGRTGTSLGTTALNTNTTNLNATAPTTASPSLVTTTGSGAIRNSYNASLDAAWEPDIWGKIRRSVEENRSLAEASAADLASADAQRAGGNWRWIISICGWRTSSGVI